MYYIDTSHLSLSYRVMAHRFQHPWVQSAEDVVFSTLLECGLLSLLYNLAWLLELGMFHRLATDILSSDSSVFVPLLTTVCRLMESIIRRLSQTMAPVGADSNLYGPDLVRTFIAHLVLMTASDHEVYGAVSGECRWNSRTD